MDNVLVVSSSTQATGLLGDLLRSAGYSRFSGAASGAEARRLLVEAEFDVIVINAPLSDEFGHELAISVSQKSSSGVIMIIKSDVADEVSEKVEDFGVIVVAKPIGRALFYQALKLAGAVRNRIMGLRSENTKLQSKIEEIRLVDRAKCVLIQYLKMTEPQAHRYIEKQAMDLRVTRREIAQNILQTYEF